jgi:hypothetical protein
MSNRQMIRESSVGVDRIHARYHASEHLVSLVEELARRRHGRSPAALHPMPRDGAELGYLRLDKRAGRP